MVRVARLASASAFAAKWRGEAPAFEALALEALAIEAPALEALAIEALSIEALAIKAPALEALAIEALAIEALSIEALSIEVPPPAGPALAADTPGAGAASSLGSLESQFCRSMMERGPAPSWLICSTSDSTKSGSDGGGGGRLTGVLREFGCPDGGPGRGDG